MRTAKPHTAPQAAVSASQNRHTFEHKQLYTVDTDARSPFYPIFMPAISILIVS